MYIYHSKSLLYCEKKYYVTRQLIISSFEYLKHILRRIARRVTELRCVQARV